MQVQDVKPYDDINITPMLDLAYVLLVIFIITAPLLTHAVKIDLPKAESHANLLKVDNVQLAIDGSSTVFWNGEVVDDAGLAARMQAAAALPMPPEIHIHADRNARYEPIAKAMSEAARHGLTKIGFVTDPAPRP